MKRTGFKKKLTKPMKRGKLRKVSKQPISKIQKELWQLCKQIIRKRHGNSCFTCDQIGLMGSNWHTGHLIPKGSLGAYLKYDLRILRPQCYKCNINLGGNGAEFYRKMLIEIGPTAMDEIIRDKQKSVKAYEFYQNLILEYQKLI